MKEYKKIFKIFVAGQEDKETAWLSQMSKDGYHLVNVSFATYYTFKKGEPKDYTYMIDMKGNSLIGDEEYISIYEDYELEYIDKSHMYYYFRGESNVDTKDIIQNEKGRYLDRINSQKKIIGIGFIANILIFIVNLYNFKVNNTSPFEWMPYMNLAAGLICLFAYININKQIKNMKVEGVKVPYNTQLKDWKGFLEVIIVLVICMVFCGIGSLISVLF